MIEAVEVRVLVSSYASFPQHESQSFVRSVRVSHSFVPRCDLESWGSHFLPWFVSLFL